MEWILAHYLTVAVTVFSCMGIAWVLYLMTQNPGVVDVFWALGLMAAGVTLLLRADKTTLTPTLTLTLSQPKLILLGLLGIWGLRLGLFLFLTRVAKKEKDERYLDIAQRWKTGIHLKFLVNFFFQALLQTLLSSGLLAISAITLPLSGFSAWVLILFLIGLVGETWADWSLLQFKKKSENQGKVCEWGLWKFSRHPNYFFEFLVWTSISLWSFLHLQPHPSSALVFLAPLTLLFIFLVLTIPLTETQALKKRSESYRDYQQRVSVFIPWIPRKTKT